MLKISASNVRLIIVDLAERSPIIIQSSSSNPSSQKNLDVRTTVWLHKVLLLTCVVNCTTGTPTPWLCSVVQWSVHWASSWMTQVLVLARAKRCALEMCRKKKMRAPLLGLAKSIYYMSLTGIFWSPYLWAALHFIQLYCFIYTSASCLVLTL